MFIKIPISCVVAHPKPVIEGKLDEYTPMCINLDRGANTQEESYLGKLLLSLKSSSNEFEVYDKGKMLYFFTGSITSNQNAREFLIAVSGEVGQGPQN